MNTHNSQDEIRQEFSAGGVVFKKYENRNSNYEIIFLVGKHSGYHKWVLPKGMIEAGESAEETAVREVQEEMGVEAKIIRNEPLHVEMYQYWAEMDKASRSPSAGLRASTLQSPSGQPERRVKTYQEDPEFEKNNNKTRVEKTVTWFLMEWVSGNPADHDWEMEDGGWFTFEEAMNMLSFEGEKKALIKAKALIE